jgi:hypothetical protein
VKEGRRLRHLTVQWVNEVGRSFLCFGVDPTVTRKSVSIRCTLSRWIVPATISSQEQQYTSSALIDTASTHLFLPDPLVDAVRHCPHVHYDKRTERAEYTGDMALVDTHLPTFTLSFSDDVVVRVCPSVYVAADGTVLLGVLERTESSPYSAILGLPFVTRCCRSILFDFGRLRVDLDFDGL